MKPRKLIITNTQNKKLVGLLHDTGSKEIVIMCHGFMSNKKQRIMVSASTALEKEGISAFRFDFPGNGDSDGSLTYGQYWKEVEDLCAIVKYFNGSNCIVTALVGHSKGGDIVLLYASKYDDVRIIVDLSGRYDLKQGMIKHLGETSMERIKKDGYIDFLSHTTGEALSRVTEESLVHILNIDMREACLKIDIQCRILIVHGSGDEIVPVSDAYEFAKIIPNHKLHIIEGANHGYSKHKDELIPVIMNFIKACLEQHKTTNSF